MKVFAPQDTLAYQSSRVVHLSRDMGALNVKKLMEAFRPRFKDMADALAQPERQAVTFYGLNHAMALISARHHPMEPLPPETLHVVEHYHSTTVTNAVRAWYYLLLICCRESRHTHAEAHHHKHWEQIALQFGDPARAYLASIKGAGSGSVVSMMLDSPPDIALGTLTKMMAWNFHNGPFSSSFGGHPWGNVADCLHRFVTGQISCEIMMDTVWTLAHNGGPIFNKGMLYKMYGQNLLRILDLQRGGQIPEALISDPAIMSKNSDIIPFMKWLKTNFPDKIGDYVDWVRVKALGAIGEYPSEIAAQKSKHGTSAHEAAAAKLVAAKEAIEAQKAAQLKANEFEVMPGLVLHKVIRPAPALAA